MADKQKPDLFFDYLMSDIFQMLKHLTDIYDVTIDDLVDQFLDMEK